MLTRSVVALSPLARHSHRPSRASSSPRVQLHRQSLHLPRCLDQQLRRRRSHLPAVPEARAMESGMAYMAAHPSNLPVVQYLSGNCAVHPASRW